MLRQICSLELTKQKKSFYAASAVTVLSIVLIAFLPSYYNEYRGPDVIRAGMTFLVFFGSLGLAVLFGAMHGAALRREPERSVEEPLPIPPRSKIFGCYLSSLLYLFTLLGFLLLLYPSFIGSTTFSGMMDNFFAIFISSSWLLAILHLHLISFALAYWTKQPILGAGLSAIIFGMEATLILRSFTPAEFLLAGLSNLSYFYNSWWELSPVQNHFVALLFAIAIFLTFCGLSSLVRKTERGVRLRIPHAFFISVCLVSGVLLAIASFLISVLTRVD